MRSVLLLLVLTLSGCQHAWLQTSSWPVHKWKGQWQGVEGTFINIQPDLNDCRLTIQNLDGAQTYACTLHPDAVLFFRNGQIEALRQGTGEDTGMKWLQDRENCLVVRTGEGYCR